MKKFIVQINNFLKSGPISAYYHEEYNAEMGKMSNYNGYIHVLNNTYNEKPLEELSAATSELLRILCSDINRVIQEENLSKDVLIIGIPRAQSEESYNDKQLLFRSTIEKASNKLGLICENNSVIRIKDTKTTHIKKGNVLINGKLNSSLVSPYPGLAKDSCYFNEEILKGKDVILIDDAYTKNANIAEDFIQSLKDLGSNRVIFYCCWYTIN